MQLTFSLGLGGLKQAVAEYGAAIQLAHVAADSDQAAQPGAAAPAPPDLLA